MAWTSYQVILGVVMVVTGSINTLSTKWADNQKALNLDKDYKKFDHPFLQAVGMFIGEFSCLIVYLISRCISRSRQQEHPVLDENPPRKFNPFVFLPAALCDMCGTSIMYIGLNLTFASSFQMLRGSVIIFTALLSVAFLGRIIKRHMWIGMFTVMVGLVLVGLSDILFKSSSEQQQNTNTNGVIAGDLLIIMAQIIAAVQMVYEERFVTRYNVHPLAAVGWEGFWGALSLGLLLIPFYYIHAGNFSNTAGHRLENVPDAFEQMKNNHIIIIATAGNIVSIAFFNFAGISVTKELSATTRMVLDSVRTLVIWMFSLAVKWQDFQWLQIVGFLFLVIGMSLYNDIIIMPLVRRYKEGKQLTEQDRHNSRADEREEERQRLLGSVN
ncbi:solute carrier family 35 member F6-like [Mya arenaria]|uniref:solute carrier family 35 member F6-like n=1 Tax=Mya arenaria TaxID=6604 RepID=UPI0022E688AC|nr:solute carrier family 35 member F6-like [Mya arenaria]XP_052759842.1 solute carrier family 35 member F6-like [Mya arenaria]